MARDRSYVEELASAHDALARVANNPDAPEQVRQAAEGLAMVIVPLIALSKYA